MSGHWMNYKRNNPWKTACPPAGMPFLKFRRELIQKRILRQRFRIQKALCEVAAGGFEKIRLFGCLHALGKHHNVERFSPKGTRWKTPPVLLGRMPALKNSRST
jgi:hypothetical protein